MSENTINQTNQTNQSKPIVYNLIDPLGERYASTAMKDVFGNERLLKYDTNFISDNMRQTFSDRAKYLGWRDMWITISKAQQFLGIDISDDDIYAMEQARDNLDIDRGNELDRKLKHDLMAFKGEYIEKIREINPDAGKKLHLGCTSMEISDNDELITMKKGLEILSEKLRVFYSKNEYLGGYINQVIDEIEYRENSLKARGMKGTTGTQGSFLKLFEGDETKVMMLDNLVAKYMGFGESYAITGQTYPRIVDYQVLSTLDTLGVALNEIASQKIQLKEEFEILSNYLHSNAEKAAEMASVQWLERSLDDSSERRIIISESFYIADIMIEKIMNYDEKPTSILGSLKDKLRAAFGINEELFEYPDYNRMFDFSDYDAEEGLNVIKNKAVSTIKRLEMLSEQYKYDPCVTYTHGQFAQPHVHGKRFALWNYNYVLALNDLENLLEDFNYLSLDKLGNSLINSRLTQFAIASSKMALDIRILQHDLELNEPFGTYQVGSSAMPYKKNPMTAERINGLSRNKFITTKGELTQDDFYSIDSIMDLSLAVLAPDTVKKKGFTVHTQKSLEILSKFMPFFVAEDVIMEETEHHGKDRDEVHEQIRLAMLDARKSIDEGGENNMLELLVQKGFNIDLNDKELLEPTKYIGLSVSQVTNFNANIVQPILKMYESVSDVESEVKV